MGTKAPWQSKTIWSNAIIALAAFYPPAQVWVAMHPELFSLGLAGLNLLLRFITSKGISVGA